MTRALAALALALCAASASADTLRWHAPSLLSDGVTPALAIALAATITGTAI